MSVRESVPEILLDKTTCNWSEIAWSLPAGKQLRARIEELQARLRSAEAELDIAAAAHVAEDNEKTQRAGRAASADDEVLKCRSDRQRLEAARALAAAALEEGLRAAGTVTKAQLEEVILSRDVFS